MFNTKKNLRGGGAILAAVLFALICFYTSNVRAQVTCGSVPDCISDPWNGPYLITINVDNGCGNGGTCPINIAYCTRFSCGSLYDVEIIGLSYVGGCFCDDGTSGPTNRAIQQFITTNAAGFPCPTCPDLANHYRFFINACSHYTSYTDPQGHLEYGQVFCDNTNAWCVSGWDACCDGTGYHISNFSTWTLGDPTSCDNGTCTSNCPTW